MDEQATKRVECPPVLEPSDYERLYQLLHAYHFGAISFLELLDAFEEALHLKPRDTHDHIA